MHKNPMQALALSREYPLSMLSVVMAVIPKAEPNAVKKYNSFLLEITSYAPRIAPTNPFAEPSWTMYDGDL